jgi:hypothetical protein
LTVHPAAPPPAQAQAQAHAQATHAQAHEGVLINGSGAELLNPDLPEKPAFALLMAALCACMEFIIINIQIMLLL